MSIHLFLKACGIWLMMAALAVANGALRDQVLTPLIGPGPALPLSGLSLAALVMLTTYVTFPLIGRQATTTYLLVGLQWVVTTLLFDGLLGRYLGGRSWVEILQVFDVAGGNLFVVVLLTSLLAPLLVARLKGLA